VPANDDVVAYLRCVRVAVNRHGDHEIVIGEVERVETRAKEPLLSAAAHGGESRNSAPVAVGEPRNRQEDPPLWRSYVRHTRASRRRSA
jgi:flavin reductase (DIM6/NTAB) family NADH-FMN oxidoreductase RutF